MMKTGAANGLRRTRGSRDTPQKSRASLRALSKQERYRQLLQETAGRDVWAEKAGGTEGDVPETHDVASEVFRCSAQKL